MAQDKPDNVKDLEAARQAGSPRINWDYANMKSSYANVCNATGTREEVVLYFGISHPTQGNEPEMTVQLSDCVILSPFAAKRLAQLLGNVFQAYESRFDPLPVAVETSGTPLPKN